MKKTDKIDKKHGIKSTRSNEELTLRKKIEEAKYSGNQKQLALITGSIEQRNAKRKAKRVTKRKTLNKNKLVINPTEKPVRKGARKGLRSRKKIKYFEDE